MNRNEEAIGEARHALRKLKPPLNHPSDIAELAISSYMSARAEIDLKRAKAAHTPSRPYADEELSRLLDTLEYQYDQGEPLEEMIVWELAARLQAAQKALRTINGA